MGHTNSTVNYNLPQFVGTDKPSWLGDVNGAFLAIDTAIAAAKTTADSAAGGVAGLQTTVGSHTTQIGTLTDTVTAQGGTLNTVTALIGNGTPTTTDQTIIGAINEINAKTNWSLIGTGASVNISGLNEYYVYCEISSGNGVSVLIPGAILSGSPKNFRGGYFQSGTAGAMISVNATATTISLAAVYLNGSDVTSGLTLSVYGR